MTDFGALKAIVGDANVATSKDAEKWSHDWKSQYTWTPLAVVRPKSTAEVSDVLKYTYENDIAIVPVGGNTGLAGGTSANGAVMVSLDRMNAIRSINPESRVAIVESGAILSAIHDAADAHDLVFPLIFGARGSAMIGGNLSTNAGGSNVVRYGNTRDLCLGLEIVLPDGRIMDLMSELRKDNTGLNLKHLFIGAEGTLGIITAAVLKLSEKPKSYFTAMLGMKSLTPALSLLNRLQSASANAVEAFEYMPRHYIERHIEKMPGATEPFDDAHAVNILLEIGISRDDDLAIDDDGTPRFTNKMLQILESELESGHISDAVIAQSDGQRRTMWERREAAAEVTFDGTPAVDTDVAVPLDAVPEFLKRISPRVMALNPNGYEFYIAHLGDGNLHYSVFMPEDSDTLREDITTAIEDVVGELRGSFSAEHGIGISKLPSMERRKDKVAIEVMQAVKLAMDPKGLMNPGKVIPS